MADRDNRPHEYPGDEAIYRAIGSKLRKLRVERGLSLEQAEKAYRETLGMVDSKTIHQALGLTVKEARQRENISRRDLSRQIGLSVRDLILLERGRLNWVPAAYFFRISCALNTDPAVLARRFEVIRKNLSNCRQNT